MMANKERREEGKEKAQHYFMMYPNASIDTAARELAEQGCGIEKGTLSVIRQGARAVLSERGTITDQAVREQKRVEAVSPPRPFNPPRIVVAEPAKPKPSLPPPNAATLKAAAASARLLEKRRFAEDFALDNPRATINAIIAAVEKKFGEGIGREFIGEIARAAREAAGLRWGRGKLGAPPMPEPVVEDPTREVRHWQEATTVDAAVLRFAKSVKGLLVKHGMSSVNVTVTAEGKYEVRSVMTVERKGGGNV